MAFLTLLQLYCTIVMIFILVYLYDWVSWMQVTTIFVQQEMQTAELLKTIQFNQLPITVNTTSQNTPMI